ncbi:putative cytochrome P450 [Rosellinia necatrix]|uniref:Putative cytochrome P450 n=1 Tax=Rosellinia necatrix TaxID=77044 RepID=A0A1W2TCC2_ROSNE|nr:putative cytochrome P450 [Rosellinia necatrix]
MIFPIVYSLLAGLIAHTGFFIHGEWHLKSRNIVSVHFILGAVAYWLLDSLSDSSHGSGYQLAVVSICYLTSLFTSMTIYRLFFHAIVSFPGPKLAAVTKLWHVFHITDSRNFMFMDKIYQEYGKFVRTGPNEITIFHPDAIQLLDGWNNGNTKDTWYDIMQPRSSAIFTRDEIDHRERRKPWVQSLATKNMDLLRPRLANLTHTLSECISKYDGEPIVVNDVMTWFSFDAMWEVLFGQDFKLMETRGGHPIIRHRDNSFALLGPVYVADWLAHIGFEFLPFYGRVRDWFRLVTFCDEHMKICMDEKEKSDKHNLASWFIDEYLGLEGKWDLKARQRLLSGTAVSAVLAGSDTTRASLIVSWWYLCKYPEHADKIRSELDGVDVTDANILARLPHLNGVINETLRLVPPALTGAGRMTGPSGLLIDDVLIPPNTRVTAPKYTIHRLEAAFQYPDDFIPERWYSRPELVRDKQAFAPFSVGNRQCVGKGLAYIELRMVTATLVKHYNVRFAPGYDPESMWRQMRDQVTAQPGPLLCIFESREKLASC